jgi:hypothetical protein
MAGAYRSSLPYTRGSSFSVVQLCEVPGAPRLWGGHAQPLTLGVGRGGRARPHIVGVGRGGRAQSLTLGVRRGGRILLQCFALGCQCPFSWWAVLWPFDSPAGPSRAL